MDLSDMEFDVRKLGDLLSKMLNRMDNLETLVEDLEGRLASLETFFMRLETVPDQIA